MKYLLFLLLWMSTFTIWSQQNQAVDSIFKPDQHYLEDQLYFGISYIILRNLPETMAQNGFSNAIKLGFIRDIPINERRNLGFGIGLGLSWQSYYQNLRVNVDEQSGQVQYHLLTGEKYISNSFQTNSIDLPLEIRWRGSTPKKFKFWRVYSGITISYIYGTASNFVTKNIDLTYKHIKIIKPWQFGINISAGYGTWNFTFYYGLSDLIKNDVLIDGQKLHAKSMHIGFVYYFL